MTKKDDRVLNGVRKFCVTGVDEQEPEIEF